MLMSSADPLIDPALMGPSCPPAPRDQFDFRRKRCRTRLPGAQARHISDRRQRYLLLSQSIIQFLYEAQVRDVPERIAHMTAVVRACALVFVLAAVNAAPSASAEEP